MYTRCPSCQTLFRIQAQQLKAARGQVRCGECQMSFDAIEFLVNRDELSDSELRATTTVSDQEVRQWQLPFDDEQPLPIFIPPSSEELPITNSSELLSAAQIEMLLTPEHDTREAPPEATPPAQLEEPLASPSDEISEPAAPVQPAVAAPAKRPAQQPPATPVEAEAVTLDPPQPRYSLPEEPAAPHRSPWRHLAWGLGSLLLLVLLGGQAALQHRAALAADPAWRPWLEQGCSLFGCTLPTQRDLAAIEMVERTVLSHPQYQKALLITATLTNKAPFAQPYPQVELTMTDLEQKPVASRRFLPREYLGDTNPQGLFAAGATVQLRLEIADPGDEAVGFEFDFY